MVGGIKQHSCEMYDFHQHIWINLPSTNYPHKYYPHVSFNNDIFFNSNNNILFVFGGDGYNTNHWGCIEFYDFRDNKKKWNIFNDFDGKEMFDFNMDDCKKRNLAKMFTCLY